MTRKTNIGILIFLTLLSIEAGAQEILLPLQSNPVIEGALTTGTLKNDADPILTLPFREDFSYPGPFPDPRIWKDNLIFVNRSFALHPKTLGTATFDALNQFGKIYPQAQTNSYQISADFLTSHRIRLDSVFSPVAKPLTPADSVLLTFYYQPQGLGSAPRQRDSLVVEFLHTPGHFITDPENPDSNIWIEDKWVSVWRAQGQDLNTFRASNNNQFFKRVAIPINHSVYLRKDFRFRFRNYASFPLTKTPNNFAGNTCIWNVDYITIDQGRTSAQRWYYDIAFAAPAQSLLRDYQAMPWSHYIAQAPARNKTGLNVTITNLGNITYNYNYRYFVMDENNTIVRNYSGGTWNIAPFAQAGYQSYAPHANPPVAANPFGALNPAIGRQFRVFHVVREGSNGDSFARNDTIVFRQVFDNYFAYDDGVPENGYGLVGFNPKGAVRFVLGHKDTLRSVEFFFNATLNNQNRQLFRIMVWKNLQPEVILYQSSPIFVDYGNWMNQFVKFDLSQPLQVSDTIHVGWQQLTNDFLNIGFDNNSDASAHIFYNAAGEWLPTIFKGALMLRPVMGQALFASVDDKSNSSQLNLFPNPANSGIIYIRESNPNLSGLDAGIFDITGKMVLVAPFDNQIDVSALRPGIYFLRVNDPTYQKQYFARFIITR